VARRQRIRAPGKGRRNVPLLERLEETYALLLDARETLGEAADANVDVSPAGEWLLDNFYTVEEHIREIRATLPKGYYRELPELASGPLARYPRVYELAIELIAHTEGHLDLANTDLFVREFQRVVPLRIGELWAIPAMLRLGLIENIRRMTRRTLSRLDEVRAADAAAERLRVASEQGQKALAAALHDFVDHTPKLSAMFVSRFLQQIRSYQVTFTPLVWLEQWIAEDLMSAEEAVARTNQRAALTRVTIANSITSLRTIARLDWNGFVEAQSVIERVLRGDPTGDYGRMTFSARDRYRHVVERMAKRTGRDEATVAEAAISLAGQQAVEGGDHRRRHVGYWLVDDGLENLEALVAYRPRWRERIHRTVARHPNALYFPALTVITLAALAFFLALAGPIGGVGALIVVALGLIPASEIGVNAVNQFVTLLTRPRIIAKLEFREHGIPREHRTAVVVPTLIGSVDAVREALEHLEVQFLANRDPHLHFALLTDFLDAPSETLPGDVAILEAAEQGVAALNEKYGRGDDTLFYLFHRPRRWNEQEGVWMGWERKRGKLSEFNQYIRGDAAQAFSRVVGNPAPLRDVTYVITLDSDTVLPPDAAQLLVGAMAHPLNRPVFDDQLQRVTHGYGILQPRVGVSLTSAYRSRFAAIHSGHPGVDPYTTAVSDVYQDLFGEGSYTGKGIYDVDAFERATEAKFPENTLLSHDLIEGAYARAGLVTDIELYDDYPTRYLTYTRRKHRWIRGDWQILRWIGGTVPGADGRPQPNQLSAVSRWKIFDNLRRSMVEICQLLLLVAGWTVLPASPLAWTVGLLGAIAFPWLLSLTLAIVRPPGNKSLFAYYAAIWRDAVTSAKQVALSVAVLPHQAWVSADAIARTLARVMVSKRHLLEWQTASQTERSTQSSLPDVWRRMLPAELLTLGIVALTLLSIWARGSTPLAPGVPFHLPTLAVALPLLVLWALSPVIAHALSSPALGTELRLGADERGRAMRYAVFHWRFFERFVGEGTQWLAPDNFQEDPEPVVALRTSPTNIGLQLLGLVSAYDLGLLTLGEMIERVERVFQSLERMRRFRGHFFNWYELESLQVLQPGYISTVDSGNLAGHLIALKQACFEIIEKPADTRGPVYALTTAVAITHEMFADTASSGRVGDPARWQAVSKAAQLLKAARADLTDGAPDDAVVRVSRALADADQLLTAAGLAANEAPRAREWLTWATQLAKRHAADREQGGAPTEEPLRAVATHNALARERLTRLEAIAHTAHRYAMEMDFTFLYDTRRKLFAIGYSVDSATLDNSYYDLLASEARLASYVAIAKDDVPVEHWFRLGRSLTARSTSTALVSWSGSMFEYLMPLLVMRSFPHTLLDQTYRGAVRRHIEYSAERSVPWGISESAYNVRDRHLTYQYRGFGVPDLALKRGLGKELVIAPYATALALLVEPHEAMRNFAALEREGMLGPYGFREAVDYTRPDPGQTRSVVGAYMAHHIGMSFVALANALLDHLWQRRFHAEPLARAVELVLHERIPRRLVLQEAQESDADGSRVPVENEKPAVRQIETPDTPQPRVGLLASLPYTVMISNGGGGYSRYEQLAITRWRADGTRDDHGQWCYVRDLTAGTLWSATHQPVGKRGDTYRAAFATDRISFDRRDGDVETRLDVTVVSDDMAEVRRVTVVNHSSVEREIELTSYGEIVMAPPDADRAHPAFANLFVETEWRESERAILATRRPRGSNESRRWLAHVAAVGPELVGDITFETDRARFVGRGRTTRQPAALDVGAVLSGNAGAVLDPIFSLRARVRLAPGQSARVAFTTLVAETRERAIELADLYRQPYSAQRALDLSWTRTQVELRDLGLTPSDAALFQQIAGHLFYSNPPVRAPQPELRANQLGQRELWTIGLSGDWPILVASIDSAEGLPTARQLLHAHQYWRLKGMAVDLVFLITRPPSYQQELAEQLLATVMGSSEAHLADKAGGIFIRRSDTLSPEMLRLLRSTARVHIVCDGLGLGRVLDTPEVEERAPDEPERPRRLALFSNRDSGNDSWNTRDATGEGVMSTVLARAAAYARDAAMDLADSFDLSELGGLTSKDLGGRKYAGNERRVRANGEPGQKLRPRPAGPIEHGLTNDLDYAIRIAPNALPPAPWSNVVANPEGGFVVTERGGGFAWAENSYFFRLTPWYNDPVSDPATEVVYIRDASGALWSPTPAIASDTSEYTVTHGAGFTRFVHERREIASELTMSMAPDAPVKITRLKLTNRAPRPTTLVLTSFVEWALGVMREHTQHQIVTTFDRDTQALFATNYFDASFADRTAFSWISEPLSSYTADRRDFIGRNGDIRDPNGAGAGALLAEATGAALDPCAALQTAITLIPNEEREVIILLGAAHGVDQARELIRRYGPTRAANDAIEYTVEDWRRRLSAITVRTPEPLFDAIVNRWSLYQALSCRMWARSAFYQSSGAYGFRDQLQDSMAFVYHDPAIAREHILRAAARQFVEGDVQHWWHPHTGRGTRTKFSDDLAWLPYVVDQYVRTTGDTTVLDEVVPFIEMRPLAEHEHEIYDLPTVSAQTGTVYEHCLRALRRACTVGSHGLPLIGVGDWNDGMNRVGIEGRGESVWLAWFLNDTLRAFADQCDSRGDGVAAGELRTMAEMYARAANDNAWDGAWYRRAYFDDGTPLGSAQNDECKIDAIAQSWSVISDAGEAEKQTRAMASLQEHLVREDARLLMLLTPAFDKTAQDPGYIKGYLPGVRENGAQYTHAALWSVLATALNGDGDRAFELYQMINPLTHATTPDDVGRYKVEPYVVAADVYTAEGHLGRGGWTWYTGSASWMYRIGLETILGFTKLGDTLTFEPCIPRSWREFTLEYRFGSATYSISVQNGRVGRGEVVSVTVDSSAQADMTIKLIDDGATHEVVVVMA
jgi:cyclic beta-1,2-glucan synthetase